MSQLVGCLLAHQHDATVGIVEGETHWTYPQMVDRVRRFAAVLNQTYGIQPGDRVGLLQWNQKEFLISFFACRWLGAIPVPINLQFPPDDMIYVILHAGCKAIIANDDLAVPLLKAVGGQSPIPLIITNRQAEETQAYPDWQTLVSETQPVVSNPHPCNPEELALLLYTSGTTGKPKGVMLSEGNLLGNLEGITDALTFRPTEVVLNALPLFHAFGLIIALYVSQVGAKMILVPKFAPKKLLAELTEHQVTILPLVPTLFSVLLEAGKRLGKEAFSSLQLCVSGGAGLAPELLHQIEATLAVTVLEGYGLTETSPVVSVNRPSVDAANPQANRVAGSVGLPLKNVSVLLRNPETQERYTWQPGKPTPEGEILVNASSVMLGYYQAPEETQAVLDADRWFATGDLGQLDADGYLYISGGRIKDLIIKAGENIAPIRIERVLYQHPAVLEASVVGAPHPKTGEGIVACLQLKEGQTTTENEIKRFCQERLTPFMVPDAVLFYETLPKNAGGKIMKPSLRMENSNIFQTCSSSSV